MNDFYQQSGRLGPCADRPAGSQDLLSQLQHMRVQHEQRYPPLSQPDDNAITQEYSQGHHRTNKTSRAISSPPQVFVTPAMVMLLAVTPALAILHIMFRPNWDRRTALPIDGGRCLISDDKGDKVVSDLGRKGKLAKGGRDS